MTEPAVTITNFLLAAEYWAFAIRLRRVTDANGVISWFGRLFVLLGLAAILGAFMHGFLAESGGLTGRFVWTSNLLALGAAGVATAMIAAKVVIAAEKQPLAERWLAVAFLVYGAAVLFVTQEFVVALAAALPCVGFLMAALLVLFRRTATPGILFAIFGLALTLVGGVQQQLRLGIDPVHFNHNAVYHVIQMVAFFLLFKGAVPTAQSVENLKHRPLR